MRKLWVVGVVVAASGLALVLMAPRSREAWPEPATRGRDNAQGGRDGGRVSDEGPSAPEDDVKAMQLDQKACDGGDATGCYNLGLRYENGKGQPRDEDKAAQLYQRACDGGAATACFNLGRMYDYEGGDSEGGTWAAKAYEQSYQRFEQLDRAACGGKDGKDCSGVAQKRADAERVRHDKGKAAQLYGRACDGADTDGCFRLGLMYDKGDHVPRHSGQAARLYKRACDGGNTSGCFNLKLLHDEDAQAALLFPKSCANADAEGCPAHLGSMHDEGAGRFDKTFVGRLGAKLDIRMRLKRDGLSLSGTYHYARGDGGALSLDGRISAGGAFALEEKDDSGKRTGLFKGRLSRDAATGASPLRLSGTWFKPERRESLPFTLAEGPIEVDGKPAGNSTATLDEENESLRYKIAVEYPQLWGGNQQVLAGFNQHVKALVADIVGQFKKNAVEWVRDDPPKPEDDAVNDLSVGYEILAIEHGLVSVRLGIDTYFMRTVHPSHSTLVVNYSLIGGKPLALADLFRPGSDYLRVISKRCIQELASGDGDADESLASGAAARPENYQNWNVASGGLRITFDEYQVAGYVAGQPEVTVPYNVLARVLRDDGPLAPFLASQSPQ
jgi:TPR repeat protein